MAGIVWPVLVDGLLQVLPVAVVFQRPGHITKDDSVEVPVIFFILYASIYM